MRAIVITSPGGSDVLDEQERPTPAPGPDHVLVRVRAAGINRADVSQRRGNYPAPAGSPPDIPGLEYAGEVDSVGDGVSMWKAGDRVMGIVGGGAYAEFVCPHERELLAMPRDMSFEDAAAIPEAFLTAYDALFRQLAVQPGETLLIHAVASGVGTAALQLGNLAGLTVIGTTRSHQKLSRAEGLGLTHGIDSSSGDWETKVERIAPDGVDAVLDLVSGPYLAGNLRVLRSRGRIAVVGLTAGAHQPLDLSVVLRKRLRIIGTVLRSRPLEEKIALARDFSHRMLGAFDSKRLVPVVERVMPFADIAAAHDLMESNSTFGKIVVTWQ